MSLKTIGYIIIGCVMLNMSVHASSNIEGIQVYQKNVPLSPLHKQKLADDISRFHHADNLWNVLREEFSLPHYEENPAVQEKIDWYMNNQNFLLRSANRAAPYLYYILQQVKKRHLPAEIVLLPIIESGYNPLALSTVGAAGIWQLMPATAAGLGIRQDWWYDGRRDVIASTRGALNHLAYLENVYEGNWLLAFAAYDTGEGNLRAAILKNIRNGKDTDFWSLPVATETKNYVPSLLALAAIISHPEKYQIYFPPVRNAPYLAQVDVGMQLDLQYAATLAGVSYKKIMQLNPGYSRKTIPTKGPYKLVLPIENVEKFTENLVRSPISPQIDWVHYRVNPGDTIATVAKKFNTTPMAIRKLNHLGKNKLNNGANILIPSTTTMATLQKSKKNISNEFIPTTKYTLKPGDTVYMVRQHDTIEYIAKRFHVNVTALQQANRLRNNKLTPGKQIIIPTHTITENTNHSVQPGDTVYMVRRGDTVESIANRFHTTPAAIRLANLVDNNSLQEGERLLVPTHRRS